MLLTPMKPKIEIFSSKDDLSRQFGNILINLAGKKETVNLALSGGNTPKAIFDYLSDHLKDAILWEKLRFYWVDERCVLPTHPDSNYGMTVKHLLSKMPVRENQVFRIEAEKDPAVAAQEYAELLRNNLPRKNNLPCLDLTILGMGDDGHTASIFPQEMYLWNSHNLCEVATHPQTGQKRVTLTGGIINNSAQVLFLVTGISKAVKVHEILNETGGYLGYPASLVNRKKSVWFMDKDAARQVG